MSWATSTSPDVLDGLPDGRADPGRDPGAGYIVDRLPPTRRREAPRCVYLMPDGVVQYVSKRRL